MITTANLGLTVWDNEEDEFEHSLLADNFVAIDAHNHEGGLSEPLEPPGNAESELPSGHWTSLEKGLGIGTRAIFPGAIWRYLIAFNAVGHLQIGKEEVWSRNIKERNVEEKHVHDEAISTRTIEEAAVTIDKLDPNILTLGSVILWFKWSVGAEPGDLWAVMDGTAWSDIPNDMGLTEGRIPDTRKQFIRGTTKSAATGGETGGSPSVNLGHHHDFNTSQLEHTHVVSGHSHRITFDGQHQHKFANGHVLHSRMNVTDILGENVKMKTSAGEPRIDKQSLYLAEFNEEIEADAQADMDQAGLHSHGGTTALSAAFNTGGSSLGSTNIETDTKLEGVDTTPPFIGFVYIMLVRNKGT